MTRGPGNRAASRRKASSSPGIFSTAGTPPAAFVRIVMYCGTPGSSAGPTRASWRGQPAIEFLQLDVGVDQQGKVHRAKFSGAETSRKTRVAYHCRQAK